jgi:FAD-linked sulfhydryl oxidase
MTKKWGPLGWATLHSAAAAYPDSPTEYEKEMLSRWIKSFYETILCPSCMKHFADMLGDYAQKHPDWRNSRKDFSQFVFRAHNTVNVRTRKPVYTFKQSIEQLRASMPSAAVATQRRREYLVYIRADWMRNMTLTGISSFTKIKELNLIENDYWGTRTFEWDDLLPFEAAITVAPISEQLSVLNSTPNVPKLTAPSKGFNLKLSGRVGQLRSLR